MTTSSADRSPLPAYQAASRLPSLSSTTHEAWLCLALAGKIAVFSKNPDSLSAPRDAPGKPEPGIRSATTTTRVSS